MKANHTRNIIAVLAIALTTMLFTALFTISGTILNSFQQATFRQVGGDFHGTFKNVTQEQILLLSNDSLVVKSGARLMLGLPSDPPFNKAHVEVSYMDEICAKGDFCTPIQGSLPTEGTNQIACDTRILKLLGIKPEIGTKISLAYYLGENTSSPQLVKDTFTLSGWWIYDEASTASHALVPLSYAKQVLAGYTNQDSNDLTGKWNLNIYLKSTAHIEKNLITILEHHGYQLEDSTKDNYIATGINWAYMGAQFSRNADMGTILAVIALLVLITFTGYLIIYNIFQISVTNDIRFYGLLKTIGTTGKQIRHLILRQALLLAAFGIPIGLFFGYLCGNTLTPVVMSTLSYQNTFTTLNPLIFLSSAMFSIITVLISCRKPGKIAGKVSPVEAVRYTENTRVKKISRKNGSRMNLYHMALANLGRSKKKTVLVVLSLSLAVVLLQITVTFTNGLDMDKFLRHFVVTDFIVGNADYFNSSTIGISEETAVPETVINDIDTQKGILNSGKIYGALGNIVDYVTKDWYRQRHGQWNDEKSLDQMLKYEEHTDDGMVSNDVNLYGMEDFPLDHLNVIDGDLSALYDSSQNAIAAVYETDDYDKPESDSQWAKVGDQMTLRYIDTWEYYDIRTGEVSKDAATIEPEFLGTRACKFHDVSYTVVACVTIPYAMSYRYFGLDPFVLNAQVFQRDTESSNIMTYLFDSTDESNATIETFLADYTENTEPTMNYESKQSHIDEFDNFRTMFLLMGGVLCGVIGLVGVLNFLNAVLTSIMIRKREFAMLQSIGMTGRQLKLMLMCEGVLYSLFAIGISLALSIVSGPLLNSTISNIVWFFTYHFTLLPIVMIAPIFLLIGVLLPIIAYRFTARQTIVERLREAE